MVQEMSKNSQIWGFLGNGHTMGNTCRFMPSLAVLKDWKNWPNFWRLLFLQIYDSNIVWWSNQLRFKGFKNDFLARKNICSNVCVSFIISHGTNKVWMHCAIDTFMNNYFNQVQWGFSALFEARYERLKMNRRTSSLLLQHEFWACSWYDH